MSLRELFIKDLSLFSFFSALWDIGGCIWGIRKENLLVSCKTFTDVPGCATNSKNSLDFSGLVRALWGSCWKIYLSSSRYCEGIKQGVFCVNFYSRDVGGSEADISGARVELDGADHQLSRVPIYGPWRLVCRAESDQPE